MYIDQSSELYEAISNLDVYLLTAPSTLIPNKELIFEDVKVSFTYDFLFEELKFETNDMYSNIFK